MQNLNQLLAGRKVRVAFIGTEHCEGKLLTVDQGYVLVAVDGKDGVQHDAIPSTSVLKIHLEEPLIAPPTVEERMKILQALGGFMNRLSGRVLTKLGLGECDTQLRDMQLLLERYFAGQSRE